MAPLTDSSGGIHERPVETGQPGDLALGAGSFKGRQSDEDLAYLETLGRKQAER